MSVKHIITGSSSNTVPLNVTLGDVTISGTLLAPTFASGPTFLTTDSIVSGPWATAQSSTRTISYTGTLGLSGTSNLITLQFSSVNAGASNRTYISITPQIPTNLVPSATGVHGILACFDNGSFLAGACILDINSAGMINITSPGSGNFSGASNIGSTGFNTFSISYIITNL